MSRKPGKLYSEAFPMLDIPSFHMPGAPAGDVFQWVDQAGRVVGYARLSIDSDRYTKIGWRFFGTPNVIAGTGKLNLPIHTQPLLEDGYGIDTSCPDCARKIRRLFYVRGYWACNRCQELTTLNARMSPVLRQFARYQALEVELALNMRYPKATDRAELLLEFERLAKRMCKLGITELPPQLLFRTTVQRMPADSPVLTMPENPPGYGWHPADGGGLDLLTYEHQHGISVRKRKRLIKPWLGTGRM